MTENNPTQITEFKLQLLHKCANTIDEEFEVWKNIQLQYIKYTENGDTHNRACQLIIDDLIADSDIFTKFSELMTWSDARDDEILMSENTNNSILERLKRHFKHIEHRGHMSRPSEIDMDMTQCAIDEIENAIKIQAELLSALDVALDGWHGNLFSVSQEYLADFSEEFEKIREMEVWIAKHKNIPVAHRTIH